MADPVAQYIFLAAGLDFNSTADQSIVTHVPNCWIARRVTFYNASRSLNLALGGIYTGPNKTGTQLVLATQDYLLLDGNDKYLDIVLPVALSQHVRSEGTIYFSLTTKEGVPATADLMIWGDAVGPLLG